jgi:hypothetical protein
VTDWGVPDWRDADAYSGALTDRQWWWEFTRRRPDYRHLWEHAQVVTGRDYRYAPDVEACRLQFELSVVLDPRRSFDDWQLMHDRVPRNGGLGKSYEHLNIEAARSYLEKPGMSSVVDQMVEHRRHKSELEEEAGVYSYTFNLTRPLKAQLRKAEEHLQIIQDELYGRQKWKPEPANWPSYLRILDARDSAASWRVIGETLWANDLGDLVQRARMHHAGAVNVRDRFPL